MKTIFAPGAAGEELLERRQFQVGWGEVKVAGDLPDDLGNLCGAPAILRLERRVKNRALDRFLRGRQPDAAVPLRVHVNQKRLLSKPGQARRKIDAGRR